MSKKRQFKVKPAHDGNPKDQKHHPEKHHLENKKTPPKPDIKLLPRVEHSLHSNHDGKINSTHSNNLHSARVSHSEQSTTSDFHPFKKQGFFSKLSYGLQKKGLPPLPILVLVLVVLLSAIMPLITAAFLVVEPNNVDIFIAIQQPDGSVIKGAEVVLANPDNFNRVLASTTQKDGLAFFQNLPVGGKYIIYAELDGKRIEVEERELKVPFARGRKEIIIIERAVS